MKKRKKQDDPPTEPETSGQRSLSSPDIEHKSSGDPSRHRSRFSAFFLDEEERKKVRDGHYNEALQELSGLLSDDRTVARRTARATIDKHCRAGAQDRLSSVNKLAMSLCWSVAATELQDYATLHEGHIDDISCMDGLIRDYTSRQTLRRPLNFLMMATPGAGKSHFVKCLTRHLTDSGLSVDSFTYNMASMASEIDLLPPLDAIRNIKVSDKTPILFLDEFDASPRNFGLLLPLLWDGEITLGTHRLQLGKIIVVMAGSGKILPTALKHAQSMQRSIPVEDIAHAKLVDLMSRINGSVMSIPGLNNNEQNARVCDKLPIFATLVRANFRDTIKNVPLGLLKFIYQAELRYDVRSLAHIVDFLEVGSHGVADLTRLNETLSDVSKFRSSSLVYHLIDEEDNAHGVRDLWVRCNEKECFVPLVAPAVTPYEDEEGKAMAIAYSLSQMENSDAVDGLR